MRSWLLALAIVPVLALGCPSEQPQGPEDPAASSGSAAGAPSTAPAPPALPPIDPDAPVDRDELATPWARAVTGSWAEYTTLTGKLRVDIVSTDDSSVTVRKNGGEPERIILGEAERAYLRDSDPNRHEADSVSLTVKSKGVAGAEIPCLVVEALDGSWATWHAEDIPFLDGIVLRRKGDTTERELTAFELTEE